MSAAYWTGKMMPEISLTFGCNLSRDNRVSESFLEMVLLSVLGRFAGLATKKTWARRAEAVQLP